MFAIFYFERGECLAYLKKLPAAIADFDKAIEFEPQYIRAYFERGKCFEQLEKFSAAVEDFSRVIEEFPDPSDEFSAEAYYRRGKIHERTKNFAAREKDFAQAARNHMACIFFANSSDTSLWEKIFDKPTDNEPIDDATDNLTDEQLIHAWQNFAVPTLGHGKCSFDLGEFEVALKDFNAVIAAVPNAKNLFYIKYSGWDLRTFDEFNFNRVLVVLAYVGRGQCFQQFGNVQRAQADFDTIKDLGGKFLDFAGR